MWINILKLTSIVVMFVCFGGLMYTIHKFRQISRESEEKGTEKNWRAFLERYRPFNPQRRL